MNSQHSYAMNQAEDATSFIDQALSTLLKKMHTCYNAAHGELPNIYTKPTLNRRILPRRYFSTGTYNSKLQQYRLPSESYNPDCTTSKPRLEKARDWSLSPLANAFKITIHRSILLHNRLRTFQSTLVTVLTIPPSLTQNALLNMINNNTAMGGAPMDSRICSALREALYALESPEERQAWETLRQMIPEQPRMSESYWSKLRIAIKCPSAVYSYEELALFATPLDRNLHITRLYQDLIYFYPQLLTQQRTIKEQIEIIKKCQKKYAPNFTVQRARQLLIPPQRYLISIDGTIKYLSKCTLPYQYLKNYERTLLTKITKNPQSFILQNRISMLQKHLAESKHWKKDSIILTREEVEIIFNLNNVKT